MRLKALVEIYTMQSFAQVSNLPEDLLVELAGRDDPPERLDLPLRVPVGLLIGRGAAHGDLLDGSQAL